ncbi:MAG: DUF4262 domain-containing protein [Planctomycetota bacterium]
MDEIESFLAAAREEITEHGYKVVLIEEDGERPAYGFTIGLSGVAKHPEVLVIGLDDAEDGGRMHDLLDAVAERVLSGEPLVVGQRDSSLLEGHLLGVRAIDAVHLSDWLAIGVAVLGRDDFPAVQLLWPDRFGRLPIDLHCEAKVIEAQPVLGS